jgi:glycosyltransferase involved in cell wall biosynthesis
MKLTFIIRKYPPEYSGAAVQIALLIPQLIKKGHHCRVTCFQPNTLRNIIMPVFNYPVVRIKSSSIPFFWRIIDGFKIIWKELKTDKSDVYCYYGSDYFIYMHLWFNKLIIRKGAVFVTMFDTDTPSLIKKERYFTHQKLIMLKKFDKIVCIAPFIYSDYRNHGYTENQLILIPNCVDLDRFHPVKLVKKQELREKNGIQADVKVLLTVGRISSRKNQIFMCKVLQKIQNETIKLALVGPRGVVKNLPEYEDYSKEIENYIETNGLSSKIIFVDTTDSIHEWYQLADVFLFASRAEGFGNVQVEAMACGLPSVVLRIPGLTEFIYDNGQDGFIIDREDVNLFESAINHLFKDELLYLSFSEHAVKSVRNKFDINKISQEYENVFLDVNLITTKYSGSTIDQ